MSDSPPPPHSPRPYPAGDPQLPQSPKLAARLGARLVRRPEARFGTALAAAGAVLVIGGVLVWGFGYLFDGLHISFDGRSGTPSGSSGRRLVGVLLSLALVAGGYALVLTRRRGALATAG